MRPRASVATLVRTAWALGLANVARVASYRIQVRLGWHPVQRLPAAEEPAPPFFAPVALAPRGAVPSEWPGPHGYFGWRSIPGGASPPDWWLNPLTGARADGDRPWWALSDFDPRVGDIKGVWEASRFDWAVRFALRARAGDRSALETLNHWLADWRAGNPAYHGPNWKCGQEASIRVMHLALTARLLDAVHRPEPALLALLRTHLRRIYPTLGYAIGQDNNHGTSEAAALFLGGVWLSALGQPDGARYAARGRAGLEERGTHLIMEDGTFSQHSVNYHRLVLDTYSLVELWRRDFGLASFSPRLLSRLRTAVDWLALLVEPLHGDAPNLGPNDGANLLPLTDAPYRDFRPCVQLAGALFRDQRYYAEAPWCDAHLAALSVPAPTRLAPPGSSRALPQGGLIVLRDRERFALLRFPQRRFRPGHADALHVDLWVGARNHLRDDGSFSYSHDPTEARYFGGVRGHNSVQFDDAEPMPRIGRFLWGDWVHATSFEGPLKTPDGLVASADYTTAFGARHERRILLASTRLDVTDRVAGFTDRAVWRWRLLPGAWSLREYEVSGPDGLLQVTSDQPIRRIALTEGWESRHYAERTTIPVLEVEIASPGVVRTTYAWKP